MSFLFTPDFLESRDAIVVCSVPCFFSQPCFHSIPVFTCAMAACAGGEVAGGEGGDVGLVGRGVGVGTCMRLWRVQLGHPWDNG